MGRDIRGPWLIRRLGFTGVGGAAHAIAVDELVDRQAEVEPLLAADANLAVAGSLLDMGGIAALVADALGLTPDV